MAAWICGYKLDILNLPKLEGNETLEMYGKVGGNATLDMYGSLNWGVEGEGVTGEP